MKFIYSNVRDILTNLVYFFLICYFGSSIDSLRQSKNKLEDILPVQENNNYYKTTYPYNKLTTLEYGHERYETMDEYISNWRIYLCKDVMIAVRNLFHLIAKIPNFNSEYVNTLYFYLLPIPLCFLLMLCARSFTAVMSLLMLIISIYICFGVSFNKNLPKWVSLYVLPGITLIIMCLIQDYKNDTTLSGWMFKFIMAFYYSLYGWYMMFVNMGWLCVISCYSILYFMFVFTLSPFLIEGSYMNMLRSLYKHKLSLIFVFILLTLRSSIAKLNSIKNPYKNHIIAAEICCGIFMLYYFNKKINSN